MAAIIVTGSVGTGKTTLSKKLAKQLGFRYIDVNMLIKEQRLASGYDKKRRCKIIDIKKLNKELIKLLKNDVVVDSHLSHYLPSKHVDLCIVTKCKIKELHKRLKKRRYPKEKIRENLDCEIFDVCLTEAMQYSHNIFVIDTTKGLNTDKISKQLEERLDESAGRRT